VVNAAINRRKSRRRYHAIAVHLEEKTCIVESSDALVEADELTRRFTIAIVGMTRQERVVFYLHVIRDFSRDEIARLLGLSLKTVLNRWCTVINALESSVQGGDRRRARASRQSYPTSLMRAPPRSPIEAMAEHAVTAALGEIESIEAAAALLDPVSA
jgi:hypothetical protein